MRFVLDVVLVDVRLSSIQCISCESESSCESERSGLSSDSTTDVSASVSVFGDEEGFGRVSFCCGLLTADDGAAVIDEDFSDEAEAGVVGLLPIEVDKASESFCFLLSLGRPI
jgi:hypothetical protein